LKVKESLYDTLRRRKTKIAGFVPEVTVDRIIGTYHQNMRICMIQ